MGLPDQDVTWPSASNPTFKWPRYLPYAKSWTTSAFEFPPCRTTIGYLSYGVSVEGGAPKSKRIKIQQSLGGHLEFQTNKSFDFALLASHWMRRFGHGVACSFQIVACIKYTLFHNSPFGFPPTFTWIRTEQIVKFAFGKIAHWTWARCCVHAGVAPSTCSLCNSSSICNREKLCRLRRGNVQYDVKYERKFLIRKIKCQSRIVKSFKVAFAKIGDWNWVGCCGYAHARALALVARAHAPVARAACTTSQQYAN